jgi:hypothetical protein
MNLPHPIDSCFERVNRAEEHFCEQELRSGMMLNTTSLRGNSIRKTLTKSYGAQVKFRKFPSGSELSSVRFAITSEPLSITSFLKLARLDTGKPQDGTQFPIEDKPKAFKHRQKRGSLKGLNERHVAKIEALQPYNGCDWTKTLRDISNPDKHRNITAFLGDGSLQVTMAIGHMNRDSENAPGTISHAPHPVSGEEVYVMLHLTMQVLLPRWDAGH